VFDLGVFTTVVGATLLILVAIAHQSLRSPRGPAPGQVAHVAREGER
jgi:multicomponent K+:H+ antiporter subunit A